MWMAVAPGIGRLDQRRENRSERPSALRGRFRLSPRS